MSSSGDSLVKCYGFKIIHDKQVHSGYCSDAIHNDRLWEKGVDTYVKYYDAADFVIYETGKPYDPKTLNDESYQEECISGLCNCSSCGTENQFDFEYLGEFTKPESEVVTLGHSEYWKESQKSDYNKKNGYVRYFLSSMRSCIARQYKKGKYVSQM